jgi:hypothetical protein
VTGSRYQGRPQRPLVNAPADDLATLRAGVSLARCAACGRSFQRGGRARFCSQRCRQRAHRGRLSETAVKDLSTTPAKARTLSVYECGRCQERYLDEQQCPGCYVFGRLLGYGLACPACGDVIVLNELLAELGLLELS